MSDRGLLISLECLTSCFRKICSCCCSQQDANGEIPPRRVTLHDWDSTFCTNKVRTYKYEWWNFIFLNLFKQFNQVANLYFLTMVILQCVPAISITNGFPSLAIPLSVILAFTAFKDGVEDYRRHKSDKAQNTKVVEVVDPKTGISSTKTWADLKVGMVVCLFKDQPVPADLVILNSSSDEGISYVTTAGLDGETNLKIRKTAKEFSEVFASTEGGDKFTTNCPQRPTLECDQPNNKVYEFTGTLDIGKSDGSKVSLDPKNILLRGSVLRNTTHVHGMVIYTGKDTKIQMNNSLPPFKTSVLTRALNKQLMYCFAVFGVLVITGTICGQIYVSLPWVQKLHYLQLAPSNEVGEMVLQFFIRIGSFVIIMYGFVPIALLVTTDVVKFFQSLVISWDLKIYHADTDTPARVLCSDLTDDLGAVGNLFCDKTGTLTSNQMVFRKCIVGGVRFGRGQTETEMLLQKIESKKNKNNNTTKRKKHLIVEEKEEKGVSGWTEISPRNLRNESLPECKSQFVDFDDPSFFGELEHENKQVEDFALSLALNHDLVAAEENGTYVYSGASPDEVSLCEAAKFFGFEFQGKNGDTAYVRHTRSDTVRQYEVLVTIEFTSARKRSSVVVMERLPDGSEPNEVTVFCKGADSIIEPLLSSENQPEKTMKHCQEMASLGLRMLLVTKRKMKMQDFKEWKVEYDAAKEQLGELSRTMSVNSATKGLEKEMILLGATAIEDKLQEKVPETLAALRKTGMKVWMLTGDKVETAINIGLSCQLMTSAMKRVEVIETRPKNERLDAAENEKWWTNRFTERAEKLMAVEKRASPDVEFALVMDSEALEAVETYNLHEEFVKLARQCKSVICARATPKQKAMVVHSIKMRSPPNQVTAAIGDGANDVPMIMEAHVGIGISGKEGLQAVNNSDFAIVRFHYLRRLLQIHGYRNYRRVAFVMAYMFYKNFMLVIPQFIFNVFLALASGQPVYLDFPYFQMHNIVFSGLPIIFCGIMDYAIDADTTLNNPSLYHAALNGEVFSTKIYWLWMADGILSSILIMLVPYMFMELNGGIASMDGKGHDLWCLGSVVHHAAVWVMTLRLMIQIKNYTAMVWASFAVCILGWYLLVVLEGTLFPLAQFLGSPGAYGITCALESVTPLAATGLTVLVSLTPTLFATAIQRTFFTTVEQRLLSTTRVCVTPKRDTRAY